MFVWDDVNKQYIALEGVATNGNTGLVVVQPGHVSTGNSSTTPLLADAVFTGTQLEIINYGGIGIMVESDVASATDGLVVQYTFVDSPVDSDWHDGEMYTIPANSTKFFTPPKQAKYMRVKYTNGGTNQTEFHLHTFVSGSPFKWSSHNINDNLNDDDDGELVVSVPKLRTAQNTYISQAATTSGNAKISLEELESGISSNSKSQLNVTQFDSTGLENYNPVGISAGNYTGVTFMSKFGQNEDIGTGAFEDIWDVGGTYTYPADGTAPITHIDSSSASDTFDVEVQGLDINGNLVVQTKTLTGTTIASLDTALWRVFRLKNVSSTPGVPAIGTVQAVNAGDTVIYAQIAIGNEQTLMALYTIPNGKTGYLCCGSANLAGLTRAYSVDGHFYIREFGGVYQLKNTFGLSSNGTSFFEKNYKFPLKLSAKSDVRVRGISTVAGGVMNATFDILLIDD